MRWPLECWRDRVGVSSATRRSVMLSGGIVSPTETTLGDLRAFVARLDRWPDSAAVVQTSGAVLHVSFIEAADPMLGKAEA